jgi:putative transposase
MKTMYTLDRFDGSEIAKFRLKVILFFDQYGQEATRKAFNTCRATVYLWKKKLRKGGGKLTSLTPSSTKPHTTRRMIIDQRVYDFIANLRENNYRLGKEKIKILLDPYCEKENLKKVSVSWIGKVIRRHHLYPKPGRVYHDPSSYLANKRRRVKPRLDRRFKSSSSGELLQIDTIVKFDRTIKRYILTAIDIYSKFSFALSYQRLSSSVALDFFEKLEAVTPYPIKAVKTDNGQEFLGEFDTYLKKKGIPHYFSYPHTPESNAYVERFNRTIQEEFVDPNLALLEDTRVFNSHLIDYLLFYNTVRPHQSLDYLTPMAAILKEGLVSKMYVTSTKS